jgi:hypothetical protein
MDELYKEYGKLIVQAKVLQGKINDIEKRIAEGLNKSKPEDKNG